MDFDPELILSVLAIIAGTLVVWLLLIGAAARARKRIVALLLPESSPEVASANAHHDDLLLDDAQHDAEMARRRLTAIRLLMNAAKYVLVISAILMVLQRFNVKLDSLLFPAGFLGAALGLGAQNLVRDIVAGMFIVFEGQFAVGDVVRINGTLGTVDQIGLRVTSLIDEASHRHFFPNGAINTIETFPRRHALQLNIALEELSEGKSKAEARDVVLRAISRFDDERRVLSSEVKPIEGLSTEETHTLRFTLPIRPAREALVREKLAPRVVAALERAGFAARKTATGAEVEIDNAPAAA